MKKIKFSRFIGRQLARLKAGQSYYMMFMQTLTALGVLKWAFPEINFWRLIVLCIGALVGATIFGYIMDRSNITTMDHIKTMEMTYRYINVPDLKVFGFHAAMTEAMFEGMKAYQEGKPVDPNIVKEAYKKWIEEWSPKKSEESE